MPAPVVTKRLPLLLGFLIAVGPLSVDMYLPAFPQISHEFHDVAAPQYSLAAYFVGLGVGQMTQGALSDRLGRRLPLLVGLIVYTIASVGCAVAWNIQALVAFRFLAALGCSAGIVIPRAQVRDLADGPAAAHLFSQLMLVMGVAPILAPMFGAGIVSLVSWRWIFVFAAAYGVLAIGVIQLWVPETLPLARRTHLGLGAVLMRYLAILRERSFITHALVAAFTSAAMFCYIAATPQIFIGEFGWNTPEYAALFGMNAMAYIGYSQLNPRLVARFGIAPVISVAAAILFVTCLALVVQVFLPRQAPGLVVALLASEAGFGLLLPCSMVGALSRHHAHAGSASALLGTLQYTGGAIAGLAMGVLANGTARPMALAMGGAAVMTLLAAAARPRLSFAVTET